MNFKKISVSVTFSVFLIFLVTGVTFAQLSLDAAFSPNVTDAPGRGYINLPLPNGKVLVGGVFTVVNGVAVRNLARVNSDGSLDTSFNPGGLGPDANVFSIVPVAGGKFLLGGSFRTYNGVAQSGVTRINADGTLDATFNPGGSGLGTTGNVQTLTLQTDGKILISGSGIASYNGNTSRSIVRLNSDGTFDSSFTSGFTSNQFVEEIRQTPGGDILISGFFSSYGGVPTPQVALLSPNGTLDLAFNANLGTGPDNGAGAVFGSEVQPDGKILICGVFQDFNGAQRKNIARLNTDGTLDATFVPGTNSLGPSIGGEYFSLQTDGKILVAGSFDSVNPQGLLRLNTDGSLDAGFASVEVDVTGYSVAVQADSKIVLTGFFTEINGTNRFGIVRLNTNGTPDVTFNAGVSDFATVSGIAIQPDGKTVVAGTFLKAQGVNRRNIARFNINGTLDTTFNPGTSTGWRANSTNNIQAIALQPDGKIVAVGFFDNYNGSPAAGIVRINSDGSIDPTLDTSALSTNLVPFFYDVVILPDGSLVLAGAIRTASLAIRRLAHISSTGVYDGSFADYSIGGTVFRLVQETGGSFLIGGSFGTVDGQPRYRIARLNSDGTHDAAFDAGLPNDSGTNVQDISLEAGGNIMIGGLFTSVGGQGRNGIARLLTTGVLDTSFDPGTGADGTVFSIARQTDGKYFVGGEFTNFNSAPAKSLLLLNSDGTTDPAFTSGIGPNPTNLVRRLLFQPDGKLLVGGAYNLYAGFPRGSLVRLTNTSAAAEVGPGDTVAEVGTTTVSFDTITSGGTVLSTPISPGSVDANLPGNYVISGLNLAFEIQTTATYTGSIVIAFRVPNSVTAAEFAALRIVHGEGGTLVDRTILPPDSPAPDFANRTIYVRVTSLSPFVLAQIVTPTDRNQCKNGGWQAFTQPTFRNQGDCVSYVNSMSRN